MIVDAHLWHNDLKGKLSQPTMCRENHCLSQPSQLAYKAMPTTVFISKLPFYA